MNSDSDLYALLGVQQTAEDVVIRAAYKALAQRYHPDKFVGSERDASKRMQEINDAYAVLSDPKRRADYDSLRRREAGSGDANSRQEETTVPPSDRPEDEWAVALSFYPDIANIERRLASMSSRLGEAFRLRMILSKEFASRHEVARIMENQFLIDTFGSNPTIQEFARYLIDSGEKKAAVALAEAVRVLGSNSNPYEIINPIKQSFLPHQWKDEERERERTFAVLRAEAERQRAVLVEVQKLRSIRDENAKKILPPKSHYGQFVFRFFVTAFACLIVLSNKDNVIQMNLGDGYQLRSAFGTGILLYAAFISFNAPSLLARLVPSAGATVALLYLSSVVMTLPTRDFETFGLNFILVYAAIMICAISLSLSVDVVGRIFAGLLGVSALMLAWHGLILAPAPATAVIFIHFVSTLVLLAFGFWPRPLVR